VISRPEPLFAPDGPGDVLKRYILDGSNAITREELAKAMGVSRLTVNQHVRRKRAVTAAMALRLARVLSTTPDFWLNLQRDGDLFEARKMLAGQLKALPILRKAQPLAA
jgi:antitoxin HigA-1